MSAPTKDAAAEGVRWDLSALFSSIDDPKIAKTWSALDRQADDFAAKYRGKVEAGSLSPTELAGAIKELEGIVSEASKPANFSHLLFAADTSDEQTAAFMQSQMELSSSLRVKLMFFEIELLQAPQEYIDKCLGDTSLANYHHYVKVARTYAPYMLSETEEVILEETANTGGRAWVRLHEELTSGLKCPYTDPQSGKTTELSVEETVTKLREPDRAVRQAAADALTVGLETIEKVVVYTYNTLLADKKVSDRLRKHEYAEQSRHLSNELDKPTVDIVMRLCRERSDLVARFYKVKREILGLDELTHIDRYAPLSEAEEKIEWGRAKEIVLGSFNEFSPELSRRAKEFFDKNWIDAEPRNGKSHGAFCNYNTPDTHPVVLMSYLGKLGDVMTLAHELGHGAHASFSRVQTEFNYHGTLPLAELASIFGEMLVFDNVVKEASDKDRLALYAEKIEGIFASVHRQAAMFRFEQRCHQERREKGELPKDRFREIWQDEMQSMFGDGLALGEQHRCWWLYVGHFFFAPFYVYAYSFGELLTMSLYQQAKSAGPEFAKRYTDVLTLGGSKDPYELMSLLGVDLRSEEFWRGGFQAIEEMVSEFERLHGRVRGS
ncbi:MAG TPA: M3 family oligoendopeptidase [Fimbriimonadaceae bacterium]|nr:M3 family oligoendopeptidase [Fimbriimonadaceae bacterium]